MQGGTIEMEPERVGPTDDGSEPIGYGAVLPTVTDTLNEQGCEDGDHQWTEPSNYDDDPSLSSSSFDSLWQQAADAAAFGMRQAMMATLHEVALQAMQAELQVASATSTNAAGAAGNLIDNNDNGACPTVTNDVTMHEGDINPTTTSTTISPGTNYVCTMSTSSWRNVVAACWIVAKTWSQQLQGMGHVQAANWLEQIAHDPQLQETLYKPLRSSTMDPNVAQEMPVSTTVTTTTTQSALTKDFQGEGADSASPDSAAVGPPSSTKDRVSSHRTTATNGPIQTRTSTIASAMTTAFGRLQRLGKPPDGDLGRMLPAGTGGATSNDHNDNTPVECHDINHFDTTTDQPRPSLQDCIEALDEMGRSGQTAWPYDSWQSDVEPTIQLVLDRLHNKSTSQQQQQRAETEEHVLTLIPKSIWEQQQQQQKSNGENSNSQEDEPHKGPVRTSATALDLENQKQLARQLLINRKRKSVRGGINRRPRPVEHLQGTSVASNKRQEQEQPRLPNDTSHVQWTRLQIHDALSDVERERLKRCVFQHDDEYQDDDVSTMMLSPPPPPPPTMSCLGCIQQLGHYHYWQQHSIDGIDPDRLTVKQLRRRQRHAASERLGHHHPVAIEQTLLSHGRRRRQQQQQQRQSNPATQHTTNSSSNESSKVVASEDPNTGERWLHLDLGGTTVWLDGLVEDNNHEYSPQRQLFAFRNLELLLLDEDEWIETCTQEGAP